MADSILRNAEKEIDTFTLIQWFSDFIGGVDLHVAWSI